MSIRQQNQGSIVKPGFNPLGAQTTTYSYTYYLYSWGDNSQGALGLNNLTNYSSPKQVGASVWKAISGGSTHSIAINNNGTLWSWGPNAQGQLGLGNTTSYSSPKQVGALTNWVSLSARTQSCSAIKTDGTLWSWGLGNQGMLGLGNTSSYSSPVQVGLLTNWKSISGRGQFATALKTDGTLWSWGYNAFGGSLGLGNTTNYSSPKQVGALTNWLNVSSGNYHTIATKTDGTIWSWGNNSIGQLGQNNITNYSSPKQIGALTTWLYCAAGTYHSFALKTDGTLWSWGKNNTYAGGVLGLGNVTNYSSPKQIGLLTNWANVGTSAYSASCVKTDGTLWTWGANNLGQLGLGNKTYYSSPKQVGSLTNWSSATGGNSSLLALGY